jgi:SWI/SNF-related matrix-associated actin-dependent regulator 1 of chromatin subfamily A
MFEYQSTGIEFLATKRKAFLADEPGLGKTIQAIKALPLEPKGIVICPKIMKEVWLREIVKWKPTVKVTIFKGRNSFRFPHSNEIVIVNPDIIPQTYDPTLCPTNVNLIVDEVHQFKTVNNKRNKSLRQLTAIVHFKGGSCWGLTGTPILTAPPDLWGLLCAFNLNKELYQNWDNFFYLFRGYNTFYGPKFPSVPRPEAMLPVKGLFLRRRKADVLKQLPSKIYEQYEVTIKENFRLTKEEVEDLVENGTLKKPHIATWRNATSLEKAKKASDYLKELMQEQQIVIFVDHKESARFLGDSLGCPVITGETSEPARRGTLERFKAGSERAIVGSIGAMGVGVTLTTASRLVFIERSWTPALNLQAEDRIHRIGQNEACIITDIIGGEVDKVVNEVLKRKQLLIENTTETL